MLEEGNAKDAMSILSKLRTAMSQEEYNNGLANLYDKPYYETIYTVYTADFMKNQQLPRYVGLFCIHQSCCLLAVH